MSYEPGTIDFGEENLLSFQQFVLEELQRISDSIAQVEDILLKELNVAPDKPRNGMIVLADGTNWNPGAGGGFYGRSAGAWVKLG